MARTPRSTTIRSKRARPSDEDETTIQHDAKRPRRSMRPSAGSVTSPYFKKTASRADDESESDADAAHASDFSEDDEQVSISASEDEAEEDEYESDKPKRKRQVKKANNNKSIKVNSRSTVTVTAVKNQELWREGVKVDAEPGTEIIIKRPKPRSPGKTAYQDHTVHLNTLLFLGDLKNNNDREWLKMHDPDYRASLKDFNSLLKVVTEKIVEIDDTIPELPIKDITFRIYRDIRFSPDPTPYKPYFSAAWSRTGRKGPYAHYYLQIAPGSSFIGGGIWWPEARYLAALRRNVDEHPNRIRKVFTDNALRKEFLDLDHASHKDDDMVRAFCAGKSNAESALKTKPKGYDGDHKDILLLRLRSYTIGRNLSDEEVTSPKFVDRLSVLLAVMRPFITYLNGVVMPDPDQESEDSDEDSVD